MELFFRYALELAVVLPAAVFAFLPVRENLRWRAGAVYAAAACVLPAFCAAGAWLCARYEWDANVVLLGTLPLFLAAYFGAVHMGAAKKLFCFSAAAMLTGFCTMYTNYLAAPMETDGEPFTAASSAVCFALTVLVGAVFRTTLTDKLPYLFEVERLEHAWRYLMLIPLFLALFSYWLTPISPTNVMVGRVRPIALSIMPAVPLAFFAFCFLTWWLTRSLTESAQLQAENNILQLEQKRYEEWLDYVDQTRAMRHDFRQHLAVVGQLADAGDLDKLREYVRQLHESADVKHRRYCANLAVDALAAYYDATAKERGAEIRWTLDLPEKLSIPETEFCAMLGNLVENALHAVEALPAERRRVKAGSEQNGSGNLTICVENPYEGTVRLGRDGLPRTRLAGHGVGLASVKATVHRYDGTISLSTEGGMFSVGVVLFAPLHPPVSRSPYGGN
ncbi:MAG: GHKL domain-containing protein [Oscillospiraceae bacterium]|nr:GHKL domain-containing protein [Oscillospiraceae bacterium]